MDAAMWAFPLTLCCCLPFISAVETTSCTHFAALGKSYNVPLDEHLTEGQRIIWKHNSTKKLYDSRYGDQSTKGEKGSLVLQKVTSADAGSYTWEILSDGIKVKTKTVFLCVQESVSKPKVTSECDKKQNKVQFTCAGPQDVTYQWFEGSNAIAEQNAKILVRTSKQLGSNSFHCIVSNEVSSLSSDPVTADCLIPYKEERQLLGLNFWLMVGILAGGGGIVLVLIVATIICCSCNRRKRRMRMKDEQELRLQWSTGTNQPPHNHQYINQRGPNQGHAPGPTVGQNKPPSRDSAGNTGPRPPRARQNRPRPPDPITGQPLPGPRRHADTKHTQVPVNEEEVPPPLPQPRKTNPRRTC